MNTTTMLDTRVAELEALALEEGITLPYPPDYIVFLEDQGRMVDLASGEVLYSFPRYMPAPSAKAVAYLLSEVSA